MSFRGWLSQTATGFSERLKSTADTVRQTVAKRLHNPAEIDYTNMTAQQLLHHLETEAGNSHSAAEWGMIFERWTHEIGFSNTDGAPRFVDADAATDPSGQQNGAEMNQLSFRQIFLRSQALERTLATIASSTAADMRDCFSFSGDDVGFLSEWAAAVAAGAVAPQGTGAGGRRASAEKDKAASAAAAAKTETPSPSASTPAPAGAGSAVPVPQHRPKYSLYRLLALSLHGVKLPQAGEAPAQGQQQGGAGGPSTPQQQQAAQSSPPLRALPQSQEGCPKLDVLMGVLQVFFEAHQFAATEAALQQQKEKAAKASAGVAMDKATLETLAEGQEDSIAPPQGQAELNALSASGTQATPAPAPEGPQADGTSPVAAGGAEGVPAVATAPSASLVGAQWALAIIQAMKADWVEDKLQADRRALAARADQLRLEQSQMEAKGAPQDEQEALERLNTRSKLSAQVVEIYTRLQESLLQAVGRRAQQVQHFQEKLKHVARRAETHGRELRESVDAAGHRRADLETRIEGSCVDVRKKLEGKERDCLETEKALEALEEKRRDLKAQLDLVARQIAELQQQQRVRLQETEAAREALREARGEFAPRIAEEDRKIREAQRETAAAVRIRDAAGRFLDLLVSPGLPSVSKSPQHTAAGGSPHGGGMGGPAASPAFVTELGSKAQAFKKLVANQFRHHCENEKQRLERQGRAISAYAKALGEREEANRQMGLEDEQDGHAVDLRARLAKEVATLEGVWADICGFAEKHQTLLHPQQGGEGGLGGGSPTEADRDPAAPLADLQQQYGRLMQEVGPQLQRLQMMG
uniref:Uncharacterized protein n=1 Tax=Chromera velia CCMP2878 TaxID=1169474 RepID=A0A0G4I4X1_9ALVE|eukprot:Cvel_11024.t1-p1 / transcript=Cvel_11024.t1 / gene=Cvel_11024 / organism=Chromera_velia_CCMP2878 / gene_product=hypothetical protein / transcript_product=hypothetical protein / location=Cvel_scaffold680:8489-15167(-) / protein_length=811 / sequence_SO=supercontig / SO=protein_coding / is_pseudo=false